MVAHVSGFIGAGSAQEHLTVAKNGAPCEMYLSIRNGSIGGGTVTMPPTHGAATVRVAAEATVVSYTPARDYTGPDRFEVAFGPEFNLAVAVDIVPLSAAAR